MLCFLFFFPQHRFFSAASPRSELQLCWFSPVYFTLARLSFERNFSPQPNKRHLKRLNFRWKRKKSVMCTMNEWEKRRKKIHKRAKVPLLLAVCPPSTLPSSTLTLASLFRSEKKRVKAVVNRTRM